MEEGDVQAPLLRHSGDAAAAADGAAVEEGRSQAAQAAPRGRVGAHWTAIAIILITDMVGIGTLGLPGDFARLGWIPALATMALFIGGGVYSGSLYQRLSLKVPRAVVFDEIGAAAMGEAGRWLVYTTVYMAILTEPCIFHLMTVESLQQALSGFVTLGWLPANLIVVALILPLAQMHHLEDVAWVAIAGTIGMMVALAVVVGKLALTYLTGPGAAAAAAARTELVAGNGSFFSGMVGVVDIAFSFGGQINWMRYITSISDRTRFNSAVLVTEGVMGALYLTTGAVGYAALGKDMDVHRPVSSVLPYDSWVAVINAGVFIHCLIAYQVMVNIWSASWLHIASRGKSKREADSSDGGGGSSDGHGSKHGAAPPRAVWFAVTSACIAFSTTVVWAFPFFSELMGVIASLGDIMSMFGIPCIFAIRLLPLKRPEALLCAVLAAVAIGLSGCGLVSSVQQLVAAFQGKGGPAR